MQLWQSEDDRKNLERNEGGGGGQILSTKKKLKSLANKLRAEVGKTTILLGVFKKSSSAGNARVIKRSKSKNQTSATHGKTFSLLLLKETLKSCGGSFLMSLGRPWHLCLVCCCDWKYATQILIAYMRFGLWNELRFFCGVDQVDKKYINEYGMTQ